MLREAALLGGQAVIDRNVAGLRGRVRGWLAATAEHEYPAEIANRGGGDGLGRTLVRRLRRRLLIRRGRG